MVVWGLLLNYAGECICRRFVFVTIANVKKALVQFLGILNDTNMMRETDAEELNQGEVW